MEIKCFYCESSIYLPDGIVNIDKLREYEYVCDECHEKHKKVGLKKRR